ncbi:nicotinamide mononucleotide deamidase-related protein YfaY [Budviciaceae bacterium CWB-B4]|uniref:CinA-like protein n=1 Tax=Limnobaculum xujianqingii TaxID=2738837 RepID=A0A9D7AJ97_9GAMM|nr:nicotinamide mononucleotide deamidase-related protein YfaY [Limnobaculum xujianqingii]MBK5073927.1 nicotinamide mononucleotide deamidase-related protein YfaY [Limnobaculum xujianqingii]MBK5177179.1 nicotinamide mononucleotide deamidase-related protein YfaY [Limnobaculum xujianqingii]
MLVVEMLSTGDEVLHGQIVDTNAAWLADCFFQQGLPLSTRTTVGDNLDSLVDVLLERSLYADVLIVNGGLGPTSDDLSALAAATAAGESLIEHPEWIAYMESYFAARGRVMSDTNRKQAMIPESAELVDNPVGTACGFALTINDCLMFFTPGVPSEFKVMVNDQILPRLRQRYSLPPSPLCLRLTSFGRTESSLAQQFDVLTLPEGCVMGYRSSMPIIELKLTGPASQRQEMLRNWQIVKQGVEENVLYEGTEGLPAIISRQLTERGLKVALSEQFSAGLLSWNLFSVQAPVLQSEVRPSTEAQSLEQLLAKAKQMATQQQADISIAIGARHDECLSLALVTPNGIYAQRVRYMPRNHSVKVQQDVSVTLALDMLSRWFNQRNVFGSYEWLEQAETLAH